MHKISELKDYIDEKLKSVFPAKDGEKAKNYVSKIHVGNKAKDGSLDF